MSNPSNPQNPKERESSYWDWLPSELQREILRLEEARLQCIETQAKKNYEAMKEEWSYYGPVSYEFAQGFENAQCLKGIKTPKNKILWIWDIKDAELWNAAAAKFQTRRRLENGE